MKRLFGFALVSVLGLVMTADAADEYLYWMVGTQSDIQFDYAKVAATDADGKLTGYLSIADVNEAGQFVVLDSTEVSASDDRKSVYETWSYLGNAPTAISSILIELWSDSLGKVGYSDSYLYSALKLNNNIAVGGLDQTTVLNVTSFTAVPEPTSGLLMLLGAAALALRRKRFFV